MPLVKILLKESPVTISLAQGTTLLQGLQGERFDIYSPCGGNGTCGKCKVHIVGEGDVMACVYPVFEDIEILFPEKREANILVDQHQHTISVPFNPGKSVNISSYPQGVAIDIGTTTLAFYLVNLITGSLIETRAVQNPQSKYGSDVISRINYTVQFDGGLQELQREIVEAINIELAHFIKTTGIVKDDIVKIAMAGNTTMLHLLLGIDPVSIAMAPFAPVFIEEQHLSGQELSLNCHPEAEIKVLPSIAAYVGADIVAGIASINPAGKFRRFLFLDIGTNGEIAVVTPEKIWCCATAAGPAFEGANISCGMPAVEGAINKYDSYGYTTIGNLPPAGLCGSGVIDVVAHLVRNNLVQSDGLLTQDFQLDENFPELKLVQQDIREVQLAKSAIMAGIKVLLKNASLCYDDLDALVLAGGFGNYIDIQNAIAIGLLPGEMEHKIISMGNTSGTGTLLALKSVQFDEVLNRVTEKSNYIELSGDEDFVLEYVMNMDFGY